jgi:DNA-binding transcriptional ArsR family regulator
VLSQESETYPNPEPSPEPDPKPDPSPDPDLNIDFDEDEEDSSEWSRRRRHDYARSRFDRFDKRFEKRFENYIEDFVEDIMEGVVNGLENSLFINSRPRSRPLRHERKLSEEEIKTTADAMSALSNEHRIKILDLLTYGGMYASDFQQALPEISPSTLSSHLDILEKAGFLVQERRRGRYVISITGRIAVKMAHQVAKRIDDEY